MLYTGRPFAWNFLYNLNMRHKNIFYHSTGFLFLKYFLDSSCSFKGWEQETEDDSFPFSDGHILTDVVDITVEMESESGLEK